MAIARLILNCILNRKIYPYFALNSGSILFESILEKINYLTTGQNYIKVSHENDLQWVTVRAPIQYKDDILAV